VHGYLATSVAAYRTFQLDPELVQAVHATVLRTAADDDSSRSAAPEARATTTGHIQATGVLRVGYNASIMPFCYFNADGTLVGYDVTQAYDLARSLNVRLVFIPFEWDHLERDLLRGRFDIAMAGIYVTPRRLAEMTVSAPYFQSPLALFLPAKEAQRFRTREGILAMRGVRIGVFDDPVLRPLVARLLPNAEVVVVPDYATLPDFTRIDAAVWTLEQAATLARAHEDIAVVVPRDLGSPFLFAYLMPPESSEMRRFVNYWLELRRADGSEARRLAYWIHGQLPPPTQPRWSVARDVLHWIK
jgi:ABC-type amino acid transport substrate-binding protein